MLEENVLYQRYLDCTVHLIGVGGIGSNLVPLLVRCGPRQLVVWDDDIVMPVNLAQQNFPRSAVGKSKADVMRDEALRLNPLLKVSSMRRRFSDTDELDGLVIAGVDSMRSRRLVFDEVCRQADKVTLFIDGRISRSSNEWVELYFIDPKREDEVAFYREWLYSDEEVGPQGPRPQKLSAHTPILLAGFVGTVLARWVHEGRHPLKVTLDAPIFTLEVVKGGA
jgi:hypothetical protein